MHADSQYFENSSLILLDCDFTFHLVRYKGDRHYIYRYIYGASGTVCRVLTFSPISGQFNDFNIFHEVFG